MYEDYYGFTEKPFSLTPDPKYLFKSASHANAFELLQYAIRRREGFVVITGDIGTGKTTLCRALLEQIDRKTFTALVLNPFLSEEDLLRLVLQEFGVVSRDEIKRGRLAGVSKQELIETLNEFLLSLQPLGAQALLIIDEAQNLPLQVLEQIRILSNLETEKEKLLQIVLVGQSNLKDLLRRPELRQLDQRVSIRYDLKPLSQEETSAYVQHRLSVAGGGAAVTFAPKALDARASLHRRDSAPDQPAVRSRAAVRATRRTRTASCPASSTARRSRSNCSGRGAAARLGAAARCAGFAVAASTATAALDAACRAPRPIVARTVDRYARRC